MLEQLRIENFALVEKTFIDFQEGLNIITGETGAGKSLVVEALGLLLGERASTQFIRSGSERALVEGYFTYQHPAIKTTLVDLGFEGNEDDGILLSREIALNGKNYCRINGKIIPLAMYQLLGNLLVEIHGQNEQLNLLSPDKQLLLLDQGGGGEIELLKEKTKKAYLELSAVKKGIKKIGGNKGEREKQVAVLKYHLDEIGAANLQLGEEEEILQRQKILQNAEKLFDGITKAYEKVYKGSINPSAYDQLGTAIGVINSLSNIDPDLATQVAGISTCLYQLEEIGRDLQNYLSNIEFNPAETEELIRRQDLISKLKIKYGHSIQAILNYQEEIEKKLAEMAEQENKFIELQKQEMKLSEIYLKFADELSVKRKELAIKLEEKMQLSLYDLDMPAVQFKCRLSQKLKPDGNGQDELEFYISPNLGEPLKPLVQIASGGEVARIMLALKAILADVEEIETIVFDEADSGIGGRTSPKVGKKLAQIANDRQVICITHSPQIASFGDTHIYLDKREIDGRTITDAKILSQKERMVELARMLGGGIQDIIALEHARKLISDAEKTKDK